MELIEIILSILSNKNLDLSENLKNLNKQLSKVKIEIIKKDKSKNIVKDKKIGNTNIKFRRSLGLEFVPEERNGHATVPDITLTENTFLTFYNTYSKNSNFLDDILLSSNMSSNDSISTSIFFDLR